MLKLVLLKLKKSTTTIHHKLTHTKNKVSHCTAFIFHSRGKVGEVFVKRCNERYAYEIKHLQCTLSTQNSNKHTKQTWFTKYVHCVRPSELLQTLTISEMSNDVLTSQRLSKAADDFLPFIDLLHNPYLVQIPPHSRKHIPVKTYWCSSKIYTCWLYLYSYIQRPKNTYTTYPVRDVSFYDLIS